MPCLPPYTASVCVRCRNGGFVIVAPYVSYVVRRVVVVRSVLEERATNPLYRQVSSRLKDPESPAASEDCGHTMLKMG